MSINNITILSADIAKSIPHFLITFIILSTINLLLTGWHWVF
jgi:hypothetical protein